MHYCATSNVEPSLCIPQHVRRACLQLHLLDGLAFIYPSKVSSLATPAVISVRSLLVTDYPNFPLRFHASQDATSLQAILAQFTSASHTKRATDASSASCELLHLVSMEFLCFFAAVQISGWIRGNVAHGVARFGSQELYSANSKEL